jgi:anaphase-promoting complex subunit 3
MASHALPFTPQPTLPNPARAPEVLNLLLRIVNLSLSLGLNETALFISERYSCLCPQSEEAAFLHALSLLRCSEHRQALELLKSTIVEPPPVSHSIHTTGFHTHASSLRTRRPACEASVRCAWVYAEACIALDRPNEGGECLKRAFMIFGNGA